LFLSLNLRSKGSKFHGKRLDTSSSWKTNWKVEGEDVEAPKRERERERERESGRSSDLRALLREDVGIRGYKWVLVAVLGQI